MSGNGPSLAGGPWPSLPPKRGAGFTGYMSYLAIVTRCLASMLSLKAAAWRHGVHYSPQNMVSPSQVSAAPQGHHALLQDAANPTISTGIRLPLPGGVHVMPGDFQLQAKVGHASSRGTCADSAKSPDFCDLAFFSRFLPVEVGRVSTPISNAVVIVQRVREHLGAPEKPCPEHAYFT